MSEKLKKGMLLSFEGLDGSEKTATTLNVQEILEKRGYTVKYISFPQYEGSFFGPIIKNILHTHNYETNPKLLTFLFAGDRFEAKDKINNWLSKGYVVVANRYVTSNIAYGMAKSKDEDEFMKFNEKLEYEVCEIPKPDCVVFLDTPLDIIDERLRSRESLDRYEKNTEFLKDVRRCYLKLVNSNDSWKYIYTRDDDENVIESSKIAEMIVDNFF
jgi:dTMP kinase